MSRDLVAANLQAVESDRVRVIALYEGEFSGGTVRLWTGRGSLSWDGKSWDGAGQLLGFGSVEETNGVVASGTSVSLSGIPVGMMALAISEAEQNAPGSIWLGFMSEDWELLADPILLFSGLLDVPTIIEDGSDTCTVTISYESQLIDLQRAREWRYTHESQQALYPGDLGFEYVSAIQNKTIKWG